MKGEAYTLRELIGQKVTDAVVTSESEDGKHIRIEITLEDGSHIFARGHQNNSVSLKIEQWRDHEGKIRKIFQ